MRESRTSGSGPGDQGNPVPYRHRIPVIGMHARWRTDQGCRGRSHELVLLAPLRSYGEVRQLPSQPTGRGQRELIIGAKLAPERGGGSLTALPIAETQAGNISAYIPTNLISITDGQIYLDPRLFYEDQKPAVDVGKSVSRVGGKTQAPVLKPLSESLRLEYAQFLELEVFTRFGTMVDERTRKIIEHGRRIRAVLRQPQFAPLALGEQVALLVAVSQGVLDDVPLHRVDSFRAGLGAWLARHCPEALAFDDQTAELSDQLSERLTTALGDLARSVAAPS
jgi:F-type H+-transporting ATPase subunit alpha